MATKVILPLLGQTMEEGTIIQWFKQEGEIVEKGEPLLEVMTDKVNMEVEAPASGTLLKILAAADAVVPVKELIAIIGKPGESIDGLLTSGSATTVAPKEEEPASTAGSMATSFLASSAPTPAVESGRIFASPRARKTASAKGIDITVLAGHGTGPDGRIVEKDVLAYAAQMPAAARFTPLAAKMAAERGVDPSSLFGTGIGGKVTRDDVLRAGQFPTTKVSAMPKIGRIIPFTGMRKAVAENVSKSARNAPHVTLTMEVDMTECVRLRQRIAPELENRYGVKLSFNDIVVKAAAMAVYSVPIVNSTFENDQITIHDEVNVGIAVALDEGLTVPVVRNVESISIAQISAVVRDLASRAREGKLSGEDLKDGTITITNLGFYGIDVFNPIINPPQSVILGICRIAQKPVVVDGAVVVRSMMNLCLSFDHRVMDGAPAAEYLVKVKDLLETPALLLI